MAQAKPSLPAMSDSIPVLNMPDMHIDFDSPNFLCSSSGQFDQERLTFFANTIYPYWKKQCCTLHQLAEYLLQFNIELWTASDVRTDRIMEFAFDMHFRGQYKGILLIQCELSQKEQVH